MRLLAIALAFVLLAVPANATNIQVIIRNWMSGVISNRNVTVTLTGPSGQAVAGPWLMAGDSVTQQTDVTGQTWFSNALAIGEYRLDIAGNPPRSFPFSIAVTNGNFNVIQLIGTNNSVEVFYDSAQVDAMFSQTLLATTNIVNSVITNTVAGILTLSNQYKGTLLGTATNASWASNAVAAATATNGPASGFFTTGSTNTGNFQTGTENATGIITAAGFSGPLAGNATFATNATSAVNATNIWSVISPTNLPPGLSSSNYTGTFFGTGTNFHMYPSGSGQVAVFLPNNVFSFYSDTNGTIQMLNLADQSVFVYSGAVAGGPNNEYVLIGTGSGYRLTGDNTGTTLYDHRGNLRVVVSTNLVSVNTNFVVLGTNYGNGVGLSNVVATTVSGVLSSTNIPINVLLTNANLYGWTTNRSTVDNTSNSLYWVGTAFYNAPQMFTNALQQGPGAGIGLRWTGNITNNNPAGPNLQATNFLWYADGVNMNFPFGLGANGPVGITGGGLQIYPAGGGIWNSGDFTNTGTMYFTTSQEQLRWLADQNTTVQSLSGGGLSISDNTSAKTAVFKGGIGFFNGSGVSNVLSASLATNLVSGPNLTNVTAWMPGGGAFNIQLANATQIFHTDTTGDFLFNDAGGNQIMFYSGGGFGADLLQIGRDSKVAFSTDNGGTRLWDPFNTVRVTVQTNRVDMNTNVNVGNNLTVTNSLWIINGQVTNSAMGVNGVAYWDGNRALESLQGLSANTFLAGTAPPSFTSIPDAALSANVALQNGQNNFTGSSNFFGGPVSVSGLERVSALVSTNGITNQALTASTVLVSDANKAISSLANGGANTVVHGTTPPAYSAVVEADLSLANNTTANATTSAHGLLPVGDNNANHFYNGQVALTTIPDAALSANVALDNGANPFTGLNTFAVLSRMDSLSVTNGLTNAALTASTALYADGNKRITSVPAGGAGTFLQGTTPPSFAAVQGSQVSGAVANATVAATASSLANGAVGTNDLFYTDGNQTNALYVGGKFVTISNALGTVTFNGGNQTNSGNFVVGASGALLAANGLLTVGGSPSLSVNAAQVNLAAGTFTAGSGKQVGVTVTPVEQQSGSASFNVMEFDLTQTTTGSGLNDYLAMFNGVGKDWEVAVGGNQTNFGNVKASAFYGPLHGNADTATTATTITNAMVSTNLVSGASVTNLQMYLSAGIANNIEMFYPGLIQAFLLSSNGLIQFQDVSGNPILYYSGQPYANEILTLGKDNGFVIASDRTSTRIGDGSAGLKLTVATNAVTIATNTAVQGSLGYQLLIASKTANYSVLVGDSGTRLNNNGAVVAITNTLPAASAGLHYGLDVVAGFNLAFKASGSDTIRSVGTVSAGGGLVFSSTVGSTLHLFCPAAGGWWIDSTNGTWQIQ